MASRATVVFAVDQLRFNINANVSGAAPMRIRELLLDLETVQEILANPEVVGQVACGHRDGVLAVVNILNGLDPSVTPNAVAISRADDACTDLLALVADNYTNWTTTPPSTGPSRPPRPSTPPRHGSPDDPGQSGPSSSGPATAVPGSPGRPPGRPSLTGAHDPERWPAEEGPMSRPGWNSWNPR